MRFKHFTSFFLFCLFCFSSLSAQEENENNSNTSIDLSPFFSGQGDPQFSQYWRMREYYNPAFIGDTKNIEVNGLYKYHRQDQKPHSQILLPSVCMPLTFLGKKNGVGAYYLNYKTGPYKNDIKALQYAFKLELSKSKVLSFGLTGNHTTLDFNANRLVTTKDSLNNGNNQNQTIPDSISKGNDKSIDFGLGISWVTPDYYVGFSVMHILKPTFNIGNKNETFLPRSYYLTGGYNIKLNNPLVILQPSVLARYDEVTDFQLDVTARIDYNNILNGGISWRKDDSFIFLLGIKLFGFDLGYAYDLSISDKAYSGKYAHEVALRYSIPLGKKKGSGNRKSIRLL